MEISRTYIDTHVIVWLYIGDTKKLSKKAISIIDECELIVSPMVILELQYMKDKNVIRHSPVQIISELKKLLPLAVSTTPFDKVVTESLNLGWTKDPFDRLIVAQAKSENTHLLTKDREIRRNYNLSIW